MATNVKWCTEDTSILSGSKSGNLAGNFSKGSSQQLVMGGESGMTSMHCSLKNNGGKG